MKRIVFIVFVCFINCSFAQHSNDSLKMVFISSSFSLEEDYMGDWGGYTHTFIITHADKNISILWKDPMFPANETPHPITITLPDSELMKLQNIFIACSQKILKTKEASTEHILYKFKNKDFTYIIDDWFSMACYEDFKTWKQMLMDKGLK